jgi:EAL domain-containing protein (putative c-di-GMP-specific phosphodiesterase class I)
MLPTSSRSKRITTELAIKAESALLSWYGPSSLDSPLRLHDLNTGLPALTSLFNDLRPIVESPRGVTILYVHIPSSSIVEERFGWEALEAYRGIIATYLAGIASDIRLERHQCVVTRAYADDFLLILPMGESDDNLSTWLADGLTRHLAAMDQETSALLEVYVGVAKTQPNIRVHPERLLYRLIQRAQTEATDVVRQRIAAKVRVLDRCITGRCFTMLYQPIVKMADHGIFAYEALVRCAEKDLKSPHVLFDVAEQGDRMLPLGRLLRRLATDPIRDMPENALLFVNLHTVDFEDPEVFDPKGALAFNAPRVVLEVTERAAIHDFDRFRVKLSELRDRGFRLAVDDLGSGYSSLNLVAELEPDFLKLDMALIRSVDGSPVRQNLIRNIVAFASDVGAQVVAEGIETRAELETLRGLDCHLAQGYYLSMPSPPFVRAIEAPPASPRM